MRILKYIFLLLLLFVIGLTVFVTTQKGDYNITRSKVIKTPRTTVFNYINDYRNWENFSSWLQDDSKPQINFIGKTIGNGASYSWKSSDSEGNIQTIAVKENESIHQKMLFNDEVYLKRKEDKKEERDLFYLRLKEKSKERVKKIPENQVNEVIGFNPALLLPKTNIKPEEKKKKNVMKEMLIKMGMEPCSKLFIDNVSEDTEYDEILPIFSKYPGFVKLNLIAEKNICFVEFENDNQASHALLSSNNTSLNGVELKVTFAKVL